MDLNRRLTRDAKYIDDAMGRYLTKGQPEKLYDALGHLPAAGGKRLRPVLAVLACEAVGGQATLAVPYGVALELVHTFTLIHDDVMDNDDERRGLPTVHRKYGTDTAILAGDALFAKAFEVASETPVEKDVVTLLMKNIAVMAREICEGQQMDMSFEDMHVVQESDFLEMIEKKTAKMFEYAAYGGGLIGGGSPEEVKGLREYGKNLGLAFQIWDDCLDLLGDDTLGKPIGSDIRKGKKTLVVIHALSSMTQKQQKIFRGIFGNPGAIDKDVMLLVDLFHQIGSITYATQKAAGYVKKSQASLTKLRKSDTKPVLSELAQFAITRTT